MAFNYATKAGMGQLFDQKLTQSTLTNILETPNVNWLGARTFEVTTLATSGFKNHTRDKGYNAGTMSNEKKPYTLAFDRDIEFYVDTADVDETNQDLAAANITKTFIEEQAAPETDAYRFGKLTDFATANDRADAPALTVTNIYSELKKAILPVRKYGPQNLVGYLSSTAMDLLERSTEFNRNITVQNVGTSTLDSRITSIDGVTLIEVWDESRFATKFDFTDGYKVATDGKQLNALIVAKPAIIAKAKFNSIYLFEPGSHTEGDGWLYQNRLYHDLFGLEKQTDGVIALVGDAATTTAPVEGPSK